MSCPSCGSGNLAEFRAEMMIHFEGIKNVDKPGVWLFPKLWICTDCGASRFRVPEKELELLTRVALPMEQAATRQKVDEAAPGKTMAQGAGQ
jgi:heterodisulfide reductase subunit C